MNKTTRNRMKHVWPAIALAAVGGVLPLMASDALKREFVTPPDSARPGVYWYFLDGNLNRKEMTTDLESMKRVGLGTVLFLEVDLGIPQGPVKFMSEPWIETLAQAIRETDRLGMNFIIGTGPGWCGAGGPWIKPEKSMQHLVFSEVEVKGPAKYQAALPLPAQRSTIYNNMQSAFYEDVAVFAVPSRKPVIKDITEKALFDRGPFSSTTIKAYLEFAQDDPLSGNSQAIAPRDVVEITSHLGPGGVLTWDVPAGDWTIIRMGRRPTGAASRPAPQPGLGLETDKFAADAVVEHLDTYVGKIIERVGPRKKGHGLTGLHMDSWESGSQNWSGEFLKEFKKRRGYDARPLLPIYTGRAVTSVEYAERFLWDVRTTAQELVLEKHAQVIKKWGHERQMELSIEPYDMNPAGDLDLGAIADKPMCEFWTPGGAQTAYSCIEASSAAHVMGRPIVGSEAFTSCNLFDTYPAVLKNQLDWALGIGVNSFCFHTFAHQPLGDDVKPGMTFGGYGTTWNRNQAWWPMTDSVHRYMARCSHLLRQGVTVSDILYLTPEGAPHVFRPPQDATDGDQVWFPDKRGYAFDGCSPLMLMSRAEVKGGEIVFPGGTSYRLMVLSRAERMTLATLRKIRDLVKAGATVVGAPPESSPSLSGYPGCDAEVKALAQELWGSLEIPAAVTKRAYGKGALYWGGELTPSIKSKLQDPLLDSQWIWYPGEKGGSAAPPGTRYFKRLIECDVNKRVVSASVSMTADNTLTLWINGKKVADGGDNWTRLSEPIQIGAFLVPGTNSVGVSVVNSGAQPNPAGLIAAFEIRYADGTGAHIHTDGQWSAGKDAASGWELAGAELKDWNAAEVIGAVDMSPWGVENTRKKPPYPSYEVVAKFLKSLGVAEDFSTQGPVRYAHRRTQTEEIYFVANRTDKPVEAECRFRVGVGEPALWDPMTGEQRTLPEFKQQEGVTTLPLKFDQNQSCFVIFSKPAGKRSATLQGGKNFPTLKKGEELGGPWEVAFDPKLGGPAKAMFDTLADWTQQADPGIKYYSGIATYRKSFECQAASGKRVYLDLGVVHHAARVRLNGNDLGSVWCAPWRVELTKALKSGKNELEIDVANSWKNRLIGDQLPENKNVRELKWAEGYLKGQALKAGRYTYTPCSPYNKPDWPLNPSGLIGPVHLMESGDSL